MGATFTLPNDIQNGTTADADEVMANFNTILSNFTPVGMDDASVNVAAMQTTVDPYPGSSESLATNLAGELHRLRFLFKQVTGEAQWYIDPDTDLATTFAHFSDTTTHGTTGDIVGTTDTQTLSAKTLTTPIIGSFSNANHTHGTSAQGGPAVNLQTERDTSGNDTASFEYTSIDASVRRITIMFVGVSTAGTSIPVIQLGDVTSFETSGYLGVSAESTTYTAHSNGFNVMATHAATYILHGAITLTLENASSNTWVVTGSTSRSEATQLHSMSGSKSLTGTLTRIKITTAGESDNFDAGAINVTYG